MPYLTIEREVSIELDSYSCTEDIRIEIEGSTVSYSGEVRQSDYSIELELDLYELAEMVDGLDSCEFEDMMSDTGHENDLSTETVAEYIKNCDDIQIELLFQKAGTELPKPKATVANIVEAIRVNDIDLMAVIKQYVLAVEHGA